MTEELTKICTKCLVEFPLSGFNKGNAKYKRKSWCRKCQNKINGEYKKRPDRILIEREHSKKYYNKFSKEQREKIYIRRREYVLSWIKNNPEKYKAVEKSKSVRRRTIVENLDPIAVSSLVLLESYNISTYNPNAFSCEYCSSVINGSYSLDHIIPVTKNGTNDLKNLAISCKSCNSKKRDKLLDTFYPEKIVYFLERNKKLCPT